MPSPAKRAREAGLPPLPPGAVVVAEAFALPAGWAAEAAPPPAKAQPAAEPAAEPAAAAGEPPAKPQPAVEADRTPAQAAREYASISRNRYVAPAERPAAWRLRDVPLCDCCPGGGLGQCLLGTCVNAMMQIECHPRHGHRGGHDCGNQRLGRGQLPALEVRASGAKGLGLFVAEAAGIPAGALVAEYVGEVVPEEEHRWRQEAYAATGDAHEYFMVLDGELVIDASRKAGVGRFANHSCQPNCDVQKWTVDGEPRVAFVAADFLPLGAEVTIDYQFERYGKDSRVRCLCGAEGCRQWLDLPRDAAAVDGARNSAAAVRGSAFFGGLRASRPPAPPRGQMREPILRLFVEAHFGSSGFRNAQHALAALDEADGSLATREERVVAAGRPFLRRTLRDLARRGFPAHQVPRPRLRRSKEGWRLSSLSSGSSSGMEEAAGAAAGAGAGAGAATGAAAEPEPGRETPGRRRRRQASPAVARRSPRGHASPSTPAGGASRQRKAAVRRRVG